MVSYGKSGFGKSITLSGTQDDRIKKRSRENVRDNSENGILFINSKNTLLIRVRIKKKKLEGGICGGRTFLGPRLTVKSVGRS